MEAEEQLMLLKSVNGAELKLLDGAVAGEELNCQAISNRSLVIVSVSWIAKRNAMYLTQV